MTWSACFGGKASEIKTAIEGSDLPSEAQPASAVKAFIAAQVPSDDDDARWSVSVSGSHFANTDGSSSGASLSVSVNKLT